LRGQFDRKRQKHSREENDKSSNNSGWSVSEKANPARHNGSAVFEVTLNTGNSHTDGKSLSARASSHRKAAAALGETALTTVVALECSNLTFYRPQHPEQELERSQKFAPDFASSGCWHHVLSLDSVQALHIPSISSWMALLPIQDWLEELREEISGAGVAVDGANGVSGMKQAEQLERLVGDSCSSTPRIHCRVMEGELCRS